MAHVGRPKRPPRPCANTWCTRPHHAKGYCATCYQRAWSTSDPARATTVHREWQLSRADVDEIAVQRLTAGDPPERTTLGEREEAVRRLHAHGLNDRQIADRMHRRVLFVWRIRDRLGLPANQHGPQLSTEIYFVDHLSRSRLKRIRQAPAT